MRFVNYDEKIIWNIVYQRIRTRSGRKPRNMTGIILDPLTGPHLSQHFHIVPGSLLDPLRFDQLASILKPLHSFF